MLYGRRVLEPQSPRDKKGSRESDLILNKSFQYKYCLFMITAVAGGALLFFLPTLFFLNQNYELFKSLAFDTHPQLVEHLEREVTWLKGFIGLAFICIAGTTLLLSARMTRNLIAPLIRMEKHMQQLMLGKWHIADYQFNEHDNFKDLSMTYDYFYRSLKANTEVELALLSKLGIDQQNREAYAAWKQLIITKRARLGITEDFISNENVATLNVSDQKRHAS